MGNRGYNSQPIEISGRYLFSVGTGLGLKRDEATQCYSSKFPLVPEHESGDVPNESALE